MTDIEDSHLPRPPKTPFGKNIWNLDKTETPEGTLLSDKMAMAAAEGRLEDFINSNIPDSEQARALAMMMFGMTTMADMTQTFRPKLEGNEAYNGQAKDIADDKSQDNAGSTVAPSEEMLKAVDSGDIYKLKEMLKEEHMRRSGPVPEGATIMPPAGQSAQPTKEENELLLQLHKIAADNKTNVDWLMMRALRFYIEDYERTGKL